MIAEALRELVVQRDLFPPRLQIRGQHLIVRRVNQRLLVGLDSAGEIAIAIEDLSEQNGGVGQGRLQLQDGHQLLAGLLRTAQQVCSHRGPEHQPHVSRLEAKALAEGIRRFLQPVRTNGGPARTIELSRRGPLRKRGRIRDRQQEQRE